MKTLVIFKIQQGELTNAYSLVDKETFLTIPSDLIHASKEIEDKLYSSEELEQLRDELI